MAGTKTTEPRESGGFTEAEKAAMQERSRELKAARRKGANDDGEADLLAKIAEMPQADRVIAERLHAIVREVAPVLKPRTWYGMPAWALDGKVVCFFKSADKFKSRYATFGFEEAARIDEGTMWPTSFGLTKLSKADEQRLADLVKRAMG
jgi:uncharacterized protein YdhG (YjbR/CyaY superfamily)